MMIYSYSKMSYSSPVFGCSDHCPGSLIHPDKVCCRAMVISEIAIAASRKRTLTNLIVSSVTIICKFMIWIGRAIILWSFLTVLLEDYRITAIGNCSVPSKLVLNSDATPLWKTVNLWLLQEYEIPHFFLGRDWGLRLFLIPLWFLRVTSWCPFSSSPTLSFRYLECWFTKAFICIFWRFWVVTEGLKECSAIPITTCCASSARLLCKFVRKRI